MPSAYQVYLGDRMLLVDNRKVFEKCSGVQRNDVPPTASAIAGPFDISTSSVQSSVQAAQPGKVLTKRLWAG